MMGEKHQAFAASRALPFGRIRWHALTRREATGPLRLRRSEGFDPEASDLDFVVSFEERDPPRHFDRYFGLKEDLEDVFGREASLVTENALLNDPDFA